ncbi:hypothetical protein BG841_10355 [Marinobacter sp. X15-166B]|nr:hypothetical protein BG841_10355 [Marinobacter sp. X15-166B]
MKRSGPPLKQQKKPLGVCGECNGRGLVRPMFYELPCDHCLASGIVDKETGATLPAEELILQLQLRLREARESNRNLQEQVNLLKAQDARGYGYMGKRYHGD